MPTHRSIQQRMGLLAALVVLAATWMVSQPREGHAQEEIDGCPQYRCSGDRRATATATIASDNVTELAPAWNLHTGERVYGSPSLDAGVLYVPSEDHHVYAVDAKTGEQRWAFRTDNVVWSTPAIVDGTVFFGSTDDHVYAVDAATGEQRWKLQTGGDVTSSPAVAGGVVYVGSNDHHLYAIAADDGEVLWKFETDDRVSSSPAVANDTVFVGSNDHHLYAIDAETGAERWRYEADMWVWVGPTVVGDRVFFTSDGTIPSNASNGSGGSIYALDATTGEEVWSEPFSGLSAPVVADDLVVASSYTDIAAFDVTTGEQRWSTQFGEQLASPFVVNDVVLAVATGLDGEGTNGDGSLIALDLASGEVLHEVYYRRLNKGYSSPVASGTHVYFGAGYGLLHAVSLDATEQVDLEATPIEEPLLPYSDHRDILGNFLNPGSVAELRLPGDGVDKVLSSQDPKWLNSYDRSNSQGLTEDGREILADIKGPGVMTNMMMYYGLSGLATGGPGPPACHQIDPEAPNLAMYIDNNPEPVFDMSAAQFYCGQAGFPFVNPLTAIYGGLQWSHVPVPFEERMLIVGDDPFYYDYHYIKFPDARGIQSFDPERDRERYEAMIERWSSPGVNPHPTTDETQVVQANVSVAPGESVNLMDVAGAGQINEIRFEQFIANPPVVTTPSSDPENDPRQGEPMLATRIGSRWDGAAKPQVDAPVGVFFGTGFGQAANYDSLMVGMNTNTSGLPAGWPEPSEVSLLGKPGGVSAYSFWPMPFAEDAEIWLTNTLPDGGSTVEVAYEIEYEPGGVIRDAEGRLWRDGEETELGYFHAEEYYNFSPKDNSAKPERNINDGFLRVQGRGNFVGNVLNMRTHTFGAEGNTGPGTERPDYLAGNERLHYLEGDCMFWIDDAPDYMPDVYSTGHEECFDSGGPYFQYNVNNMTAGSTQRDTCGVTFVCTYTHEISAFHWYTGDAISFENQFEATIEHGSENTYEGGGDDTGVRAEHSGVSFYYLQGQSPPHGDATPGPGETPGTTGETPAPTTPTPATGANPIAILLGMLMVLLGTMATTRRRNGS